MSLPNPPDDDTIREAVETERVNERNRQHYEEHADEFEERYGGCVIAIIDEEVVASTESTGELADAQEFVNRLRREHGEHKARGAFITRVPKADEVLIL